ncbi:MAG: hypothetical protein JNK64_13515 [Myxococcales bacterium]|nr:hypothetical protein [Myxococcales bacterium]
MRAAWVLGVLAAGAGCADRPAGLGGAPQPVLGPEFGTGVAPLRIRAANTQYESAVACDDAGTCLALYDDLTALRAHRVDAASGAVLDQQPRMVASSVPGHLALDPAIAFGGGQYLAVWSRAGVSGDHDLVGLRIGADGQPLDAAPFVIAATPNAEVDADVAWAGGGFLVAWTSDLATDGTTEDARVIGARVDAAGTPGTPFELSPTTQHGALRPAIATDGSSFLVVWGELLFGSWTIRGRRFDTAGAPLGPSFGITGLLDNDRDPDVGFADGQYLVAWVDNADGVGGSGIYMRRLAPDGTGLGDPRTAVATSADAELEPVVSTDGTDFLVAYQRAHAGTLDVYGSTVSAAGAVGAPFVIAGGPEAQDEVDVAAAAGKHLAVFVDYSPYTVRDVVGARITAAGVVEDPAGIAIATSISSEVAWTAAAAPGASLVVWTRYDGVSRAYAQRVDPTGAVLDAIPIALPGPEKDAIAIAWASSVWLVVFRERGFSPKRVFGVRIAADGAVLDPTPFEISPSLSNELPVVASDGTSFLVFLESGGTTRTRRVFADGTLAPLSAPLPIGTTQQRALAWNGTHYLLLTGYDQLEARRLAADGTLLDGTARIVGALPSLAFPSREADVASDGTDWLVVFSPMATGAELHVRRMHDDGTMDPPRVVASGPGLRHLPYIAFDGARYAIAYDAYDAGTMLSSRHYQWLAPDGTPYPGAEGDLATDTLFAGIRALSGAGNGTVLATYDRPQPAGHTTAHGRYVSCDACVLPIDAGVDAPPIDAGLDAPPIDAGLDARPIDAPGLDARPIDAPGLDATAPADGAPDAATPAAAPGGCGCDVPGARTDAAPALLVLALVARPRRRRVPARGARCP